MGYVGKSLTVNAQMKFCGEPSLITLDSVATTTALNSITLPSITGIAIDHAYAGLGIIHLYETSSANNYVSSNQHIQVDQGATGLINAISLPSGALRVTADQVICCAGEIMGDHDVSSRTSFGSATTFQWTNADVLGDSYIMCVYPILYLVVS